MRYDMKCANHPFYVDVEFGAQTAGDLHDHFPCDCLRADWADSCQKKQNTLQCRAADADASVSSNCLFNILPLFSANDTDNYSSFNISI